MTSISNVLSSSSEGVVRVFLCVFKSSNVRVVPKECEFVYKWCVKLVKMCVCMKGILDRYLASLLD